jgi:hypothetical protein
MVAQQLLVMVPAGSSSLRCLALLRAAHSLRHQLPTVLPTALLAMGVASAILALQPGAEQLFAAGYIIYSCPPKCLPVFAVAAYLCSCSICDWLLCAAHCRLFQQPKQQGRGYHQTSAGGSLSRAASASDDLQLLNALRDQQQQQYQQQLAAQASSASVLSMAASLAAGGAQQKPATLARAVAGIQTNPKDWKDRVDKINALAEVLNRQVRPAALGSALSLLAAAAMCQCVR